MRVETELANHFSCLLQHPTLINHAESSAGRVIMVYIAFIGRYYQGLHRQHLRQTEQHVIVRTHSRDIVPEVGPLVGVYILSHSQTRAAGSKLCRLEERRMNHCFDRSIDARAVGARVKDRSIRKDKPERDQL